MESRFTQEMFEAIRHADLASIVSHLARAKKEAFGSAAGRAPGAVAYRWEDLTKAPLSASVLLNPRRYGDGAKDLWTTLNCVQENTIRGGQRDPSRRRPNGYWMPKSRAIRGIDEDMKLNKALREMAEVLRNGGAQ